MKSGEPPGASVVLGQTLKRLHRHISNHVMQSLQTELSDLDLSFSQMNALHQLRCAPKGLTVTELSSGTQLSVPAASQLVEKLVQRGLSERHENPDNRREKLVTLTERAHMMLGQMDDAFAASYIRMFGDLPGDVVLNASQALDELLAELEAQILAASESPANGDQSQETP